MRSDIHSHLLPGIDDGSPDRQTTEKLLQALYEQGVTNLALTPHFYPATDVVESFLEKRQAAMEQLLSIPIASEFNFTLGAEVYMTEALFNHADLPRLCYEGTGFLLTELEYNLHCSPQVFHRLERLMNNYNVVPILAHIDRYPFFDDYSLLERASETGCLFQCNLQGFFGFRRFRKLRFWAMNGKIHFLGLDLHTESVPVKKFLALEDKIERKLPGFLQNCDENAESSIFIAR